MAVSFCKMHGLGNDFVIFNNLPTTVTATPQHVINSNCAGSILKKIADRHLGIGCDQILFLEPAKTKDTDFYCRIFNADGSEAGVSGNGLRCLARFIYDRGLITKRSFVIATMTRNIAIFIEDDKQITLNMGIADFEPQNIPILATKKSLSYNLQTEIGMFDVGAVSVGNPHAVIKVDDIDKIDLIMIGKSISAHSLFPQQANVNFMQILDRSNIRLRTYERGTGETLACGSGSSAAVAIGRIWQLLDDTVTVHLHHGNLRVKCQDINSPVFLTGPAIEVFDGTTNLEFL